MPRAVELMATTRPLILWMTFVWRISSKPERAVRSPFASPPSEASPVLTTVREFRLLEYLAAHCGRVLTRDQLLDAVWKETPFVTPRSIDVYVRRLREKIEADPRHPRYLKTLRGIGYRFEAPK